MSAFNESQHNRQSAGSYIGGQFAPKSQAPNDSVALTMNLPLSEKKQAAISHMPADQAAVLRGFQGTPLQDALRAEGLDLAYYADAGDTIIYDRQGRTFMGGGASATGVGGYVNDDFFAVDVTIQPSQSPESVAAQVREQYDAACLRHGETVSFEEGEAEDGFISGEDLAAFEG